MLYHQDRLSTGESYEAALHSYTTKCCTNEFISYFYRHSCPVARCVVSIPLFALRSRLFFLYFSASPPPSLVLEQVYYRFTCHLFCQIYFPFTVHHHNHHPISTGILALSGLLTTRILSQLLAPPETITRTRYCLNSVVSCRVVPAAPK